MKKRKIEQALHLFKDPGEPINFNDYQPVQVEKDPEQSLALIFARLGRVLDPDRVDPINFGDDLTSEAVRWTLLELSLVAVAADQSAVARSFGSKSIRNRNMEAKARRQVSAEARTRYCGIERRMRVGPLYKQAVLDR